MASCKVERMAAERGCCENLLRRFFKFVNVVLVLLGVSLIGYGLYLLKVTNDQISKDDDSQESRSFLWFTKTYWFVEASIFCGVWTCCMAAFALLGTSMDNGCCIGVHTILILITLIAEAIVVVVIYFNKNWDLDHLVPIDESGKYEEVRDYITNNLDVVLYIGLGVVVLQSLSLLMACGVWSLVKEKKYNESDDEGEIWKRRSLLPDTNESNSSAPTGVGAEQRREDPWSSRMREKYGLDTGKFTYDPEKTASRGLRDRDRDRSMLMRNDEEKKGWCMIM